MPHQSSSALCCVVRVACRQEDLSLRSCFCVVDGAAKLLFSVPSRHDAAFAAYVQSRLPRQSQPLQYRGKSLFFIPDAATVQRFDISARVCGVGEFVLIDNGVWHCGVNLGANCSVSVNVLGAGGLDALQRDAAAILSDLCEQRQRMVHFLHRRMEEASLQSDDEWRLDWNAALKQLQKQVSIYNGQPASQPATPSRVHTHTHTTHTQAQARGPQQPNRALLRVRSCQLCAVSVRTRAGGLTMC